MYLFSFDVHRITVGEPVDVVTLPHPAKICQVIGCFKG